MVSRLSRPMFLGVFDSITIKINKDQLMYGSIEWIKSMVGNNTATKNLKCTLLAVPK